MFAVADGGSACRSALVNRRPPGPRRNKSSKIGERRPVRAGKTWIGRDRPLEQFDSILVAFLSEQVMLVLADKK